MEEFQIGDTVRLKSGGPLMTVDNIGKDSMNRPMIWCSWFDGKQVLQTKTFVPATLEKDDDNIRVTTI
jgi:uncharacterized protein YodC (DUF2158 family)